MILHAYGFDHTSFETLTDTEIMSPTMTWPRGYDAWELSTEPTPLIHQNVDACTKEGIDAAAAPE